MEMKIQVDYTSLIYLAYPTGLVIGHMKSAWKNPWQFIKDV